MSRERRLGVGALVARYAARLRFPYLFLATAILFVGDLFFPDLLPFADEILLGLLAALFGTWRKRRLAGPEAEAPGAGEARPRLQADPLRRETSRGDGEAGRKTANGSE